MARCCTAVGVGVLVGLVLAVVAPWLVFNLRDTNLMRTR
jgi:hypothetical protein